MLAAVLREQAADMAPGERLPSVTALCQAYGLSVKTVRKAVRLLADEGLVRVVPGLGTFRL